eukprot:Blabericola_migrator_1__13531@NODE_98_length_14373_cov_122_493220_g88_i0_p8_GENE_NODE_98_length_14373_cov_122_493220_g88_i0NODE_98_length_14373_cov_122_493220_g88_i0_p8_ORF_typecomplete_len193_score38_42Myosin_tail_1/PF01576_19/1_4e06HOOK/PF05622_12/0_00069CENPF_leu_zip/PF10473_9/0_42CENPF_leu_zip/PF10473_9/0_011Leu_zip/PF15294_6/0_0031FtsL/PF04999_13/5_5e02FtsL/PF04999_13/74FtsL/PF04999_13/0_0048MAD/PF05557_13/0_0088GAS/PF13851_6/0_027Phage_Gp17/PF17549_2/0_025HALZ/PF02183_18/7_9e02HALZ/PF02183
MSYSSDLGDDYRSLDYCSQDASECWGGSVVDEWPSRHLSVYSQKRPVQQSAREMRLMRSLKKEKDKNETLMQLNMDLTMKLTALEKEKAQLMKRSRSVRTQAKDYKELERDYDALEDDYNQLSDELKSLKLTHAISEVTRTALEMRVQELETGEQDLEDRLDELEGAKLSVERALSRKAQELYDLRVQFGLA